MDMVALGLLRLTGSTFGQKERKTGYGRLGLLHRLTLYAVLLFLSSRFEINVCLTACAECFLRGKSVISACFSGLFWNLAPVFFFF